MPDLQCPTDALLRAYDAGSASDADCRSIERHLPDCSSCVERLDGFAKPWSVLRKSTSVADEVPSEPALERAVAAAVRLPAAERTSASLAPGSLFGEYRIGALLGQGGMGRVFAAEHVRLGMQVAVKVLRASGRSTGALERFRREMRAIGGVEHRNLIRATDAGEVFGIPYLAMERVHGRTLAEVLRTSGPVALGDACRWLRQAAAGLHAAHLVGLVHRDVKPSNLMLGDDARVRVLDLGLALLGPTRTAYEVTAHSEEEVTEEGAFLGTASFMAPEQRGDPHAVDARADIYGLGATLWSLLEGAPPPVEPFARSRLPGDLSKRWWRRWLDSDPAKRWPNMPAAAASLRRAAPSARRWRLAGVGALLACALFAVGVHLRQPPPLPKLPFDAAQAVALQRNWATHMGVSTFLEGRHNIRYALIPPGEYRFFQSTLVRIRRPFFLSTFEITNAQFAAFVAATGYRTTAETNGHGGFYQTFDQLMQDAHGGGDVEENAAPAITWRHNGHPNDGPTYPVCQVSWQDAQAFCDWLSREEGATVRLPTVAEFYWVVRCGSDGADPASDGRNLNEEAWEHANASQPHPVGTRTPNAWGVNDMFGNVAEWGLDFFVLLPSGMVDDEHGMPADLASPPSRGRRVRLGGCYNSLNFTYVGRVPLPETVAEMETGFRVVREIP